jgi:hypothetical protein
MGVADPDPKCYFATSSSQAAAMYHHYARESEMVQLFLNSFQASEVRLLVADFTTQVSQDRAGLALDPKKPDRERPRTFRALCRLTALHLPVQPLPSHRRTAWIFRRRFRFRWRWGLVGIGNTPRSYSGIAPISHGQRHRLSTTLVSAHLFQLIGHLSYQLYVNRFSLSIRLRVSCLKDDQVRQGNRLKLFE